MAELTIWSNARLSERAMNTLTAGVRPHRLIVAEKVINNIEPTFADPGLAGADVAFGQPDAGQVIELTGLRWVQLSSAGYARYDRQDVRDAIAARGGIMTNSSSVYAEPCAQHALAFILAGARQLGAAWANPKQWQSAAIRKTSHILSGQSVLILGFGQIGRRLAELLGPLKMNVTAVRRNPRGDELVRVRPASEIDGLLAEADHVVNILPAAEATERFFDAGRFARIKPGAVFYNIGRGATVDQTALRQALLDQRLAAAYLDVTDPEPLPADDPLWTTPNCFITPHTAGGAADEFDRVVEHFLANLRRFGAGEELRDRVF
jgi:phosphoglycerate dehydrogenase-like enzyme